MSGILRLESLTKGNTLKQGDKTPLKYRLFDADGEKLNIAGKSAQVRLVYPDFLTIGYEKDGLTVTQDDTVTFAIDKVIPAKLYHVEIIVDNKFVFPSRSDESKFTIDKSTLGTEASIIEIVGVDEVVRRAVDLINKELPGGGGGSGSYDDTEVKAHMGSTDNPHNVTKGQVGLDNVDNTSDANKPVSTAMQSALNNKADKSQVLTNVPANAKFTDTTYIAGTGINITGEVISATGGGSGGYDDTSVVNHMNDKTNPHDVTKSQVGLGNVDDVQQASKTEFDTHNADTTKHITASERDSWNGKQDALGFTPENTSNKGQAGGYAGLDTSGLVPVSQLPEGLEGPQGPKGDIPVVFSATPPVDTDIIWVDETEEGTEGGTEGYETLSARLDETTAQLAQKATKGEIGISDLNKNQTQFDASWFSDQFLADLSNNEINTTFLEKGSVTTDKLADRAVELEKLGFVTVNRVNLANPDKFVENSYVSDTSGNVLPFAGEVLTGYIPVEKGKQYTATSDRNKAFYDKNKTFVSGIGGNKGKTFTSPVDGYLRLSFINTDRLQMVVEGSVLPTEKHEFSDYDVTITDENLISEISSLTSEKVELKDNSVELNKLVPFTLKRTNLANPDEFVNNSYVSIATGNVLSFEGEVLTGYIPVEEGTQYTATSDRNKAFYDKNKTFVSGIGGDNGKTFISPVEGYLRLSFIASDTAQMVVEGGTVPTKYIPYDYRAVGFTDEHWKHNIKQALELTTTSLNGLKWNALGDSITAGAQSTASYIDYIAEDTGVIARNYGVSGNTIAHIPGHWAGDGMAIRYAEMDDDADIITVFGGTNDWGHGLVEIGSWNDSTNTTLYGGTQTLIEGLINKYPTKKIGFILPIPRNDINGDNALGDYVAVIKEVCGRYSIPTLDLYHNSGIMPGLDAHRTALIPDGTHPNAEGHRIIANKIQTFLESL